jgi:predicted nucleotidyltransferase
LARCCGRITALARATSILVEFQPLQPTELVDAYFGLEEQLTDSLGTMVDLVMATARRNPIVQADIDASKQLIYAA